MSKKKKRGDVKHIHLRRFMFGLAREKGIKPLGKQIGALVSEIAGEPLDKASAYRWLNAERTRRKTANPNKPAYHLRKKGAPEDRWAFYESAEWRTVRYEALLKANGACQCCGAKPNKRSPLHVDHIKPRSKFPELELEASNLQVLCQDCNLGKGAWDETDWRSA